MDPLNPADMKHLPTVNGLGHVSARGADEKTALQSFDAYFVGEMLKRSRTEDPTGLLDGGDAGRMYQDHLYQEFARIIAEQGDFGLSKTLEGQLDQSNAEAPTEEDGSKKETAE